MGEKDLLQNQIEPDAAYRMIRGYVIDAQKQVYAAVNTAMVNAYWKIGKEVYEIWHFQNKTHCVAN